jgi:hypothetical protein
MSGSFAQQNPWGASPFTGQGIGTFPGAFQPSQAQAFAQPFATLPFGNVGPSQFSGHGTPFAQPPLQQIVQSLLVVPQQLQHLLQLAQIQQHQVQYLLQAIPQQLQQLQQVVLQPGFQPFAPHHAQPFGAQPGYVM